MWTTGQDGLKAGSPRADTPKSLSWAVFAQAHNGQLTGNFGDWLAKPAWPWLISPVWVRCEAQTSGVLSAVGVAFSTPRHSGWLSRRRRTWLLSVIVVKAPASPGGALPLIFIAVRLQRRQAL
jgi:hypothetical protein